MGIDGSLSHTGSDVGGVPSQLSSRQPTEEEAHAHLRMLILRNDRERDLWGV